MKKVIDGAEYNTKRAEKICARFSSGPDFKKGAETKTLTQLYKTRSGNYFFYIIDKFSKEAAVNDDDLNPVFEKMELMDERILPTSYDSALQFVQEVQAQNSITDIDSIRKYFPELHEQETGSDKKYQKKIYLSESANWYLQMLLNESKDTNSSIIENLIREEYRRQYQEGKMNRDPYLEMNESIDSDK